MSAGKRRKKRGGRQQNRGSTPTPPTRGVGAATQPGGSLKRGAAIAALVSTAVLFGLMLLGLWVGDTVYAALPLGPLPRSRIVSVIATLATLGAGVGLIYGLAWLMGRAKR